MPDSTGSFSLNEGSKLPLARIETMRDPSAGALSECRSNGGTPVVQTLVKCRKTLHKQVGGPRRTRGQK